MYNFNIPALSHGWWWIFPILVVTAFIRYFSISGMAWFLCYRLGLKKLRKFKIQAALPKHGQVRSEVLFSVSTLFIFSLLGLVVYFLYQNGYTTLYTPIPTHGWIYFFFSLLLMFFFHDTYFYWTHRLLHTKWFMTHVHKVHHRSSNPSPFAAHSFHPIEAFINGIVIFPVVTIIPVNIIALFVFLSVVILTNVIGHLGFEFIPWKLRHSMPGKCIASSTHHNLHHQKTHKNFGYYFTVWDTLMGTGQLEKRPDPATGHSRQEKVDPVGFEPTTP
ncbi:MAG TPA: sterol desaturase family protein [Chitinophagaceae bacterium]|nr:sterol desaturase family protein [Chitinophagaceae bacterium]